MITAELPPAAVLPGNESERSLAAQPRPNENADLAGAKVLIVDDDIRNIYSLTSVLETYDIEVLHAESGAEGIALLEQSPDVDVALIETDGQDRVQRGPSGTFAYDGAFRARLAASIAPWGSLWSNRKSA